MQCMQTARCDASHRGVGLVTGKVCGGALKLWLLTVRGRVCADCEDLNAFEHLTVRLLCKLL